MYKYFLHALVCLVVSFPSLLNAREIALTFDDAPIPDSALMTGIERTDKLIDALKKAEVPDALFFVKADYINETSQERLKKYAQAGFHLANHSYSHASANTVSVNEYLLDAYKAHLLLKPFTNMQMYHRFPYLHYGKDMESINALQRSLDELGYKDGYVTVDNFDWYINALIIKAAEEKRKIDYEKARDFYVKSLYESIEFYDAIAKKYLKRSPRHVLLLHENDAAALFVGDLVHHLRSKGWKIISPERAYKDPIAKNFPQVLFHKQGRVAAIARNKGAPEAELRHSSENEATVNQAFSAAGIVIPK